MDTFLKDMESRYLREALRQAGGNETVAAGLSGVSAADLRRRLERSEVVEWPSSGHFNAEGPEIRMTMRTGTLHAGDGLGNTSDSARPALVQRGVAVAGSQGMKGMVLVVDDDEGVRAVMASALEDDGWEVATATNGRSALETLRSQRPGVIILDLRMPVMDGLTFADHYREFPEPRAPFILISATVSEAAIRATGAVTGLRKPIDLNVLLDTVREHVQDPERD